MHYLPQEISAIRKAAEDALRPAFDRSMTEKVEHWVQRCLADTAQLWRSEDGDYWAVTEVVDADKGRILHAVASAGKYRKSLLDEVEAWGLAKGCVRIITTGRLGWKHLLTDYKAISMTFEKEL